MPQQYKVTIVTVCYNAESLIEETMRSVFEQNYTDMEYIIVDGASNDCTLDVVSKVCKDYPDKKVRCISEPDKGIYDAMNKAIDMANGEWINFMNAGDTFYDLKTLSKIFRSKVSENVSAIFGNSRFVDKVSREKHFVVSSTEGLGIYMPNCHQAAFVRTEELIANNFRTDYKMISDFIFFYHLKKSGKQFLLSDEIIVDYDANGLSSNTKIVTKEYIRFLFTQCDFTFIRLCLRYFKHYIISNVR